MSNIEPATGESATPGTPRVEVRNLTKRYGSVIALRGVNLQLHSGEIVGLVGDNGAGKSTLVNIVAGEPDYRQLIRPYSIAVDSRGRAIVTDPGANGIHIFDLEGHKYKFIERRDKDKDPMRSPQCIAVDAHDNFYVTDSEAGKIFVFDSNGNSSGPSEASRVAKACSSVRPESPWTPPLTAFMSPIRCATRFS